ncbi:hypothetical protein Tco_1041952 [Tanacetum coccineum]|uniref:Reverse transcriptase n=1 Tax=Tanacetum coccineum TaxID=301880 RepID=A0ABQ5GHK2_9ASTR
MCTYLKNMEGYKLKDLKSKGFDSIQEMFDRAFKRVNTFEDFRTMTRIDEEERIARDEEEKNDEANIAWDDIQAKVDADYQLAERLQAEEREQFTIEQKATLIVDWKIYKEGKKSYYQIIRADGKSQIYRVFSQMLKSFDMEDLEDLYKLIKAKYGSTRPVEDMDYLLWNDMKIMFEPHVEDEIWKLQQGYKVLEWKLYDSCGVHSLRM